MPGRKFTPNLGAARSGMPIKSPPPSSNSRITRPKPNLGQKRAKNYDRNDGIIHLPLSPPLTSSSVPDHDTSSVAVTEHVAQSLTQPPVVGTEPQTDSGENPAINPSSGVARSSRSGVVKEQNGPGKTSWVRKKVAPKVSARGRPKKQSKVDDAEQAGKETVSTEEGRNVKENCVHTKASITRNLPEEDDSRLSSLEEPNVVIDSESQPVISTLDLLTVSQVIEVPDVFPINDIHFTTAVEECQSTVNEIHESNDCTTTDEVCVPDDIHDDNRTSTVYDLQEEVDDRSVRSVSVSSCGSRNEEDPRPKRKRSSSSSESTPTKGRKKGSPSEAKRNKTNQFREAPDRSKMTMQDLIYYNPSANPMSSVDKGRSGNKSATCQQEERSDDGTHDGDSSVKDGEIEDEEEGRIVPQLKIGADGNIVIDEQSMVVESSFKQKNNFEETVTEDSEYTTSTSFRNRHKIKKWTKEETNDFYKALSQVGTDFTMMTLILPKRSRKELKNKFKKEEKSNPVRISAALNKLCTVPSSQRTTTSSSQASS